MMNTEQSGLPIFLENTPSVIWDQVLWLIKNSGLSFQVKETPFSLDINLKKRFANLWNHNYGNPVSNQSPPHVSPQHRQEPKHDIQQKNSELLCQINSLKANFEEVSRHKNEASQELFELDRAHRKLLKENKDLLKRHEQVCSELKVAKKEKENSEKEKNSLSVALKTSKKTFDESLGNFEKERNIYKVEIEKLNHFKLEKDAERKAVKKAEKKKRQKSKKEATAVKVKEDTAEEEVTIKSDRIEPPRTVLKLEETKARTPKVCDTSVLNQHTDDAVEEVVDEAIQSVTNLSNSVFSSASAPLTKNDLEDLLKSFTERWKI